MISAGVIDWFEGLGLSHGRWSNSSMVQAKEVPICMSASIWRRSEASSLRRVFSWRTLSWDSDIWLSLSIRLWFSVRSLTTCDHSSSKCFCFLILDRRADSRLDIILRCFLSSMMLNWISSASSEVELLLRHEEGGATNSRPEGGKWQFGKLLRRVLRWRFGISL